MPEIENALLDDLKQFYRLGMGTAAKSVLSEAMNHRKPEIFKVIFEELPKRVIVYAPKHKF